MILAGEGVTFSQTISYSYDGLSRLVVADYADGSYFHYSYDSVGNRLTESTLTQTITSTYDIANRLVSVGGVSYTWDANGNLLSDGEKTYTYDSANHLQTVSGTGLSASYRYNGVGERLEETVDGVTTRFTMDLNGGLSQVLSDGTETYWYGLGRLAQQQGVGGKEYFLGDALGSVRQVVDADSVNLVESYEPYGETLSSQGNGVSNYGFTGEWYSDYIKLLYLRSRWYDPYLNRARNSVKERIMEPN